MKTICVIQHAACEPPGLIAAELERAGLALRYVRPFEGNRMPRRAFKYCGLVILGGPMGAYEQTRYHFLSQEVRLIQHALRENKPVLGVCLGSQLLATALGASVTRGRHAEIGWHRVSLTDDGAADPLWTGIKSPFVAYHWHRDVFELPRGAVSLARSRLTECQAYRYGTRAYGLLFHLEVTAEMILGMTEAFQTELRDAGVDPQLLLQGREKHLQRLQETGRTVIQRWVQLASQVSSA